MRGAAVVVALAWSAPAAADEAEPAPAVEVEDLPPLPPAEEGAAAAATVTAAIDAEEDVVVGAAKREQSLGDVASAVTVISADRLRRFGYRTIGEALRGVAGLYLVDDRITDRIGIRGLSVLGDFNTRVLVLVDGATLNEPWGQYAGVGRDAAVAIDDVARIEVIRGPVSSVYGTNAFFGILNIVTRGAAEASRGWARLGGSSLRAADLAAGFAVGTVDRQVRGTVSGLWRDGETLAVDGIGDELDNDGARAWVASLTGSYDGGFAQARFVHRGRDNPLAPFGSVPGVDSYTQYDTLALLEGGYATELDAHTTLTARGYAAAYRFSDDNLSAVGGPQFHTVGDARWIGAEVRARRALLAEDRLGLTAGLEATYARTRSRAFLSGAPNTVNLPVRLDIEGVYLELDAQPTSWLALTAGVRADRNSLLEERVSPRAALFLARRDLWGVKLLYAEGFRNPSIFEGFFDDGQDFLDNPDIGAETIRSVEAVAWARPRPGLSVRASGFRWDADGIVEQQDVGGRLQFQNVGRLRSVGAEVEASYRDRRGWYGFGGGAVTAVSAPGSAGSEDRVPNAPVWVAAGGVSSPRLWGRVHASTELTLIGRRPTRLEGRDARAFVGWNLAVVAPAWAGVDVMIGVRNLLGRREELPAQEDYDRVGPPPTVVPVVPGEGREVFMRVGYAR